MSGLLSSASPWASSDNETKTQNTKKRTPSLSVARNKTVKNTQSSNFNSSMGPFGLTASSFGSEEDSGNKLLPYSSMDDIQEKNQFRNSRVQEIIHNMHLANDGNDPSSLDPSIVNSLGLGSSNGNLNTHSNSLGSDSGLASSSGSTNSINGSTNGMALEDAGQGLANFTPLPLFSERKPDPPAKPSTSPYSYLSMERNDSNLGNSYYHAYSDKSRMGSIPSYSMDRIRNTGSNSTSSNDRWNHDKILEKLNKMIHLLEEQQHEPTKHVTEEFILYTFLGVFIIFIVDSFSKNGKYIR